MPFRYWDNIKSFRDKGIYSFPDILDDIFLVDTVWKKIITKKMVMNFIEELELIWDTWEIMLIVIPIIVYQLFKK